MSAAVSTVNKDFSINSSSESHGSAKKSSSQTATAESKENEPAKIDRRLSTAFCCSESSS